MASVTFRQLAELMSKVRGGSGLGDMLKSDNLAGLTNLPLARANLGVSSGAAFTHTQGAPATVWTINHNLGYKPVVELFNTAGDVFTAETSNPTVNQTVVNLNTATAGSARCV